MEAKKESDSVLKIKEQCQMDAERIMGEKADAEEDLAKAQPFVDEAERAVGSIKPNDLNELKKLGKPSDIIKLIFDCVSILKMAPLVKVEPMEVTLGIGKDKKTFMFIKDSYKIVQSGMLSDARFLSIIMQFSRVEKDFINEETIELLVPYLSLEGFNPISAKNASKAAEGLCMWTKAMADYHEASKIVKPKLEALRLAEARLSDAERELFRAELRLKGCQDVLEALQRDFDTQLAVKRSIEENALHTRKRMEQATSLITGLSSERIRWNEDREEFSTNKLRLVGNVALACAFIAYCGPFNQEFREYIIYDILSNDLKQRRIPYSPTIDLNDFLCDIGTIGDWNSEGLPTDMLSIQNGILVTRSNRYPLLIDPQGQAVRWILSHEENRLPPFGPISLYNVRFREQLEYCLSEGKVLIITNIEEELDPILYSILERQIITKGKNKYVSIGGRLCDYNEKFSMYLITRLANPVFSPEDQSKCTIIDFTVTQKGLEEQLLGRVIQKEQKSLEESLKNVLDEVMLNTKALVRLDTMLLERLSENRGNNLLDDEELIVVLADTKAKALDVKDKLVSAADMRKNINEKREQYRSIATRGSILYFSIVDMSLINPMYQTSLDQFQYIFDKSMEMAEKANLSSKRIHNIIESITHMIYRYINRGLYEKDKITYKLIIAFKILVVGHKLDNNDVRFFLRAGTNINPNTIATKPYPWMNITTWVNINSLSQSNKYFSSLLEDIESNESSFYPWFHEQEPERFRLPITEAKWMGEEDIILSFNRLLAVRCLREDRTILAVHDFIRRLEYIDITSHNSNSINSSNNNNSNNSNAGNMTARGGTNSNTSSTGGNVKIPALGPKYIEPITDTVDSIYREMDAITPVIYLLSAGADPTDSIEVLSKRKRKEIECVSMGEGQDTVALRAINTATANGSWVLLQNGHLGLDFMDALEDIFLRLRQPENNCSPDFRLFITTEPHPKFSIGLLQMSLKVTNEPPKGLRAGLQRSYSVIIDQDRLERIESSTWRILLFTICFLHSIVQERRKFGPLGWNIPYEFNEGDLNATIMFLEKHIEYCSSNTSVSSNGISNNLSWTTLQYMASEVQYGGRITDSIDRRLFTAYTESFLSPNTLQPGYTFNPEHSINKIPDNFVYNIPDSIEMDDYHSYIHRLPNIDSPELIGLHPNADLTFRYTEVHQLLDTIISTQPKEVSMTSDGKSRDDIVLMKTQELLSTLPMEYIEDDYEERIGNLGGLEVPLNIFLFQEIQRFQGVITKVKKTLEMVIQAIRGEIVVSNEILDLIDSIYDARVPRSWLFSPAGDELSWQVSNLSTWYSGFLQRDHQYHQWLQTGRPNSFWLAGFFNPQGFLTAVQQEITRSKKNESWALDLMALCTEVTEFTSSEHIRTTPKEGVYIHGLFMDGAGWNTSEGVIIESALSKLFCSFPIILVSAHYKGTKKLIHSGCEYECPVYKYPSRTDRYKIFQIHLATKESKPLKWILRGVALLCQTS